ncbi:DUF732 domain-containing protein [Rhodococcus spongiicola]|uniref:DUF732 domain-containing protein n=1 Tax=Rhodococcus spongiicola TaxID=2487352 RepID=A0A438AN87_9NOCA|nr:DUF732 domain-containing protein [Rhodococcus spongiicola]RVW00100.1 DUF732 domain-containing protein [Rhodococcus spongiicola]
MSHFPRPKSARSALARNLAVGALSLVAGGLLVACGNDSSATGSPTTTAAAQSPSTAPETDGMTDEAQGSMDDGSMDEQSMNEASDEQPQALPSDFPGPTEIAVSSNGQAFLDALRQEGITPAGDGVIALSTADYICAAQEQGGSDAAVTTFVTAAVGSEASAAGQELTPEQAGENAEIYIRLAKSEYCNK